MYIPKEFEIKDKKVIEDFISKNPFATLTSMENGKIEVTHLPISRFKDGHLYGHISRANIHASLDASQEVCVIFQGKHVYISPTYYEAKLSVPTWNYASIHVYGTLEYIDDLETSWRLFHEMVEVYEGENGWKLPEDESLRALVKHIHFFRIKERSVEAKFKFSQNRSEEDRNKVIRSLRENNDDDIADFMELICKI